MNNIIFNESNLKNNEIDEEVDRVKAFIINSKNEILVALSNGGAQLIGGHVEKGELKEDTIRREIMEEAGIEIESKEVPPPFFKVSHYIKNYFDTSKNVICNIFYYIIRTDSKPNLANTKLTKLEQEYDLKIEYVPQNKFKQFIEGFLNNEKEINTLIAKETLTAFEELENLHLL